MITLEHIQKMLLLYEQRKSLTTIKTQDYDVLLEPLNINKTNTPDTEIYKQYERNIVLSLLIHKKLDLVYSLRKICEYKYSKFNLNVDNNKLKISYTFDVKYLTLTLLVDNIHLMEQLV